MRKISLLVSLLCLLTLSTFAQKKIAFEEFTLDNGLRVIMHQDNATPIVAVSVLYHVGSKNENPERTGFAHFFEHLLFEGSENLDRGEYMKVIQSAGGTLNAFTSSDQTYYYQIMPSNELELALYMESERMLHAKIDQTGVETQREVVKEEKRQSYDNRPYGSLLPETLKRAYKVHPYQWPPIGSLEHLNAASLEEFMAFYETFYVPNNAILTIAGDIDPKQTKDWVKKYFSEVPKGTKTIPRPTVVEPAIDGEIRDVIYDNIQLPAVVQAYHMPKKTDKDYYTFQMISSILSGGNSSRMNKELVDNQQKAVGVAALPLDLEDGGLFILYGITAQGVEASELEPEMDKVIDELKNTLVPEKEFQKLQNQIENSVVSGNSSIEGITQALAEAKLYRGDADYINNIWDEYKKVTREDIQRVAREYFKKDSRVVLYYLPKPSEDK
ncbi:M16 family metallopeptidase [Penaeicola halotolerans]|uniref:M16 family metallopeptidase n=1 Tax=Penaeicola halotolerans TaxID=2793196 RepID=UPI001CF915E3|nr:pitrilysin family protein [Penaeicola halotolerans]